jgi:hypothetical protein
VSAEATEWHVPDDWLVRFVDEPRMIDGVSAASIEQHLAACRHCQHRVAQRTPTAQLSAVWNEVADRIDRRPDGRLGRLAERLGLTSGSGRLLAATPALRIGALVSLVAIVAIVVWASRRADAAGVFLLFAPIVPVVLVAVSFAPGADPAGEAGLATPMFGFALIVRRAVALELLALLVLSVGSLFVPLGGWQVIAWLLPALALSLATMAGSVRWRPSTMATALVVAWGTVAFASTQRVPSRRLVDSPLFEAGGQTAMAVLAGGAMLVIWMHRDVLFQEVGS